MTIIMCFVIFVLRYLATYLVRASTLVTLFRKARVAAILDLMDEGLTLLVIYILIVDKWYPPFAISAVLGSAIATWCVARRWPKRVWKYLREKRITHKRQPFSNA